MSKNDHDDGLVHAHGWACSDRGRPSHGGKPTTRRDEPDHDDGIVHPHGWACSDRGRMRRPS